MIDLATLSVPILTGLFLGYASWLYSALGFEASEKKAVATATPSESPRGSICDEETSEWAKIQKDAANERLAMAQRALIAIPDVSCDQVAEALGLHPMQVRRLSWTRRRKGKAVETQYSKEEILAAASAVEWA